MSVEKAGIKRVAGLFSGPAELVQQHMAELAAVVVFLQQSWRRFAGWWQWCTCSFGRTKAHRRGIFEGSLRSPKSCALGR